MSKAQHTKEVLLVYLAVAAAALAFTALGRVPGGEPYVPLLVGGTFLLAAIRMARRETDGMVRYGIDLAGLLTPSEDEGAPGPLGLFDLARAMYRGLPYFLREALVAAVVILIVFPPFTLGYYYWYQPSAGFHLTFPEEVGSFVMTQIVVVALPEEAFFRGYVQTRLSDAWVAKTRLLGADLSIRAWLTQAALFALVHLMELDPQRLAVFFPGLLFGWLRARRGGIGAAILVHAASNFYAELLRLSWH
jgi:membrane protease YdiL (CAAX protease family)